LPVDSKHPEYEDRMLEWELVRDCARGETAIKTRSQKFRIYPQAVAQTRPVDNPDDPYGGLDGSRQAVVVVGAVARPYYVSEYLPMPDGFRFQDDKGYYLYHQYLNRAQFPEIFTPTINGMVGLIHRKEAVIKVPKALESIFERATPDGMSLEAFHKRVTRELLTTGRFTILPDLPKEGGDVPYLAGYVAEALINWNDEGTLFVLDESTRQQKPDDEFEWEDVKRHRVLRLRGQVYTQQTYTGDDRGETLTPKARGDLDLDFIPIVNITATDIKTCPETPPLIGVARSSIAMFRLDADYRHQLYNTGQETLVVTGADGAPEAVGAGVVMNLPLNATAQYVGPKGVGISAHRTAIGDERANAVVAGAKMFDDTKAGVESGEALRIRFAAQGATLVSVALSSAQGIERALKNSAIMVGANPDEVVVTPNLDFVDTALNPKEAAELVRMWQADAISFDTLYDNLQRGGITTIERTPEEERELISSEPPPPSNTPGGPPNLARGLPLVTEK
jgi:hypothetical protein